MWATVPRPSRHGGLPPPGQGRRSTPPSLLAQPYPSDQALSEGHHAVAVLLRHANRRAQPRSRPAQGPLPAWCRGWSSLPACRGVWSGAERGEALPRLELGRRGRSRNEKLRATDSAAFAAGQSGGLHGNGMCEGLYLKPLGGRVPVGGQGARGVGGRRAGMKKEGVCRVGGAKEKLVEAGGKKGTGNRLPFNDLRCLLLCCSSVAMWSSSVCRVCQYSIASPFFLRSALASATSCVCCALIFAVTCSACAHDTFDSNALNPQATQPTCTRPSFLCIPTGAPVTHPPSAAPPQPRGSC